MRYRIVLAILGLIAASPAQADCVKPGPGPAAPDGATAADAEMKAARQAIQGHVDLLQAYRACLQDQVKQAPADTSPELKLAWLAEGDAAIDVAQMEAQAFSVQLQAFHSKNPPAPTGKK